MAPWFNQLRARVQNTTWLRAASFSVACFVLLANSSSSLAQQKTAPSYTKDIQPIFDHYCSKCHNAEEKKGAFALDSLANLKAGGKTGPSFTAGNGSQSLLVQLMQGSRKPKMPPKGHRAPTPDQIAIVKAWIDAGANADVVADRPAPTTPKIRPKAPAKIAIRGLAFSPKGDAYAIAFGDIVRVVEYATDYIRADIRPATGQPNLIRFSADGKWLLAAVGMPGKSGAAELFDASTGKQIRSFVDHKDSVYAAEFSPDNKLVATAGYDRLIKLWQVSDGKLLNTLKGHNEPVYSLSFRADGLVLASSCTDRTVKLWDVKTGARLDTFSQSTKELNAVVFSPNGQRVFAGGSDSRIRSWRVSPKATEGSNELLYSRFAHQSPILSLTFSPDGTLVASTSEDRTVKLWDPQALIERRLIGEQSDWCHCTAFSPDSKVIGVGRHDGTISFYDVATGTKIKDAAPRRLPPPKPELFAIYPRGVQKGQPVKVRLRGKNLWPSPSIVSSNPMVTTKLLQSPPPKADEIWVELSAPGQMQRGEVDLRVASPGGKSSAASVWIDDIAQVEEPESPAPATSLVVQLPATIWGGLASHGSKDEWSFDAKKDQRIVFDLAVKRIKSQLEPVMEILGPDGRAVVDELEEGSTIDDASGTLLVLNVPKTGRYKIRVRDLQYRGSPQHTYRLSAGEFPFVVGAFPAYLPPNRKVEVELIGYNLAGAIRRTVKTGSMGRIDVPLEDRSLRFRRPISVSVGAENESFEIEPNESRTNAMALTLPFSVSGRFWHSTKQSESAPDIDLFRFNARKGESWVFETEAARLGSPADTRIEVLDAAGRHVPRVLLQATRDSEVHFRNISSRSRELRCTNWEEMELNEFMYLGGEVVRLFRLPQGPDSGFLFYPLDARSRKTYFDTTPTSHAVGDPCYIVEPHPPGSKLVANGLPTFSIPFVNDDAADAAFMGDSRLTFSAPADGTYFLKVTEIHGESGPDYTYRLTARRPAPDFSVQLNGWEGKLAPGTGNEITVAATRKDGFEGEIRIDVLGLPKGLSSSLPTTIQPDHLEAKFVLSADPKATTPSAEDVKKIRLTATGMVNGVSVTRPIEGLNKLVITGKPKLSVRLEPADVTITPGSVVSCWLVVDRHDFKDRINFSVSNLPHGVFVDNIGLNGILIPPGETRRQIFLTARKFVQPETRSFFAVAAIQEAPASSSIRLHVKPSGGEIKKN